MASKASVYVIRHLPTRQNEGRERLRGQGPAPVDKEAAAEILPHITRILDDAGVDCLYCSDLPRGRETAQLIARDMKEKPEIEVRRGFRTWDTGRETGKLRSEAWPRIERYIRNPEIKVPGDEKHDGEPFGEIRGEEGFVPRWRAELRRQLRDAAENDGKNAWIVHGNEFWTLGPLLEGRQPELKDHDAPPPGSVFLLTFDPDDPSDYDLRALYRSEELGDGAREREHRGVS